MNTETSPSDAGNRRLVGRCECGMVRYRSRTHSSTRRTAIARAVRRRRLGVQAVRRHRAGQLEIADGPDDLLIVGEETLNDTRCRACGSLLFSVVRDGAFLHVALGSLADIPSMRPTKHIFVGSKAPWFARQVKSIILPMPMDGWEVR